MNEELTYEELKEQNSDLLEVLKEALDFLNDYHDIPEISGEIHLSIAVDFRKITEAITKAEGRK